MGIRLKNEVKKVVCLIPTWFTARHALGAYKSIKKYYPDIPVYFADDEYTEQGVIDWGAVYRHVKPEAFFDPDSSKIIGLPGSCYIRCPHKGFETEGHGNAVTYAMQFIHTKWVLHLSSDVRIIKAGLLENMLRGVTNKCAGIGRNRITDKEKYANLEKCLCVFRGDLYHKYNLHFRGNLAKLRDAGAEMTQALVERGYYLKGFNPFEWVVHLRAKEEGVWNEYY